MCVLRMASLICRTWADPEGDMGSASSPPPPPLKNHKAVGFNRNTGSGSSVNHKAIKPAFNAGPSLVRQRNAI